jgi:hypothetical protein
LSDQLIRWCCIDRLSWQRLSECGLPESAARAVSSRTDRDFSTSGGFRGCPCLRLRRRADRLGRNFESILVHIESLFSVQAFDKLTCRPSNGARKTRRIHFDRRFHRSFISISIAKLNLKRFHAPNLPFRTMKTETGSRTPNHVRVSKLPRPLNP